MNDDKRGELELKVMELLMMHGIAGPEVKNEVFMVLDPYEITSRSTEIVVTDKDHIALYVKRFLASKKVQGCTDRTVYHYGKELGRFFRDVQMNPEDVKPDDIRRYLAVKQTRNHNSLTTVQNSSRVISSFYAWMVSEDYMSKNPMLKVGIVKKAKTKKEAFADMDIEKIRASCRTSRETAIIELFLSTGCRVSELCGILIADIRGDEVVVHGKGQKDRTVYLNAKAQLAVKKYLEERSDDNPYLFPKSSVTAGAGCGAMCNKLKPSQMPNWYSIPELVDPIEHQDKSSIESVVRKIGKRAGVSNVHPHRFRRTCATMALRHGMPVELVSKMLGHENIGTTQIYLDIGENELKTAHEKFVV